MHNSVQELRFGGTGVSSPTEMFDIQCFRLSDKKDDMRVEESMHICTRVLRWEGFDRVRLYV